MDFPLDCSFMVAGTPYEEHRDLFSKERWAARQKVLEEEAARAELPKRKEGRWRWTPERDERLVRGCEALIAFHPPETRSPCLKTVVSQLGAIWLAPDRRNEEAIYQRLYRLVRGKVVLTHRPEMQARLQKICRFFFGS